MLDDPGPTADSFVTRRMGEQIALERLPDVSVAVDEILPPAGPG